MSFFITAYRPPSIWNGIVEFSNKDVELKKENEISFEQAKQSIQDQITQIGENTVVVEEDYVTALAREGFKGFKDLTIDVGEGYLDINWALESSLPNKPLIAQLRIGTNQDNQIEIKRLGTPALSLPKSVNQALTAVIINLINSNDSSGENKSLMGNLLSVQNDASIESISFKDGYIELIVNINVNLYD
ncbi:hypothetical protein KC678_05530 [Candidatus Dojkabacteria bacterium]|uniref:Uncharacterized protein n=1 Tax=Candidatus Dojkabacteria bacterium TaxID=2099670 RepID=A0A955RH72_9BACT|nr:hypothetical protein [Candidatus Dojkabacteria bacterium]